MKNSRILQWEGTTPMKHAIAALAAALSATAGHAQTAYVLFGNGYDPKPNDTYVRADSGACCFGEYHSFTASYWAQTFKATGKHPHSITIGLANNLPADVPPAPFRFRLLFTEVMDPGFRPGRVLWESPDQSIPIEAANYKEYTYDVRGIKFEPGRTYAWIIDTYSTRDSNEDAAAFFADLGINAPLYQDGRLYAGPATGAGRDADFASVSWTYGAMSASFLIRYASPTH
jgi:hypothetical protein